ncbi:hypothetical protein ACFWN1_32200 [Streptomyces sp. NPDC058459]|uniref:hypothetical protein n=1 Tax=Streptomyces sp. NPDC058459 TaxID=3346508 RepID=UPI003667A6B6
MAEQRSEENGTTVFTWSITQPDRLGWLLPLLAGAEHGVRSDPAGAAREEQAREFLDLTAPGPWIVKQRDGMGSAHIDLVRSPSDLAVALAGRPAGCRL